MKPFRIVLAALAALVVAGTIANAAPGGVHGKPTSSPSVAVSETPEPSETESPEPTETESPEPTETESPDATTKTADKTGNAPDFSGCVGLTGLDNAICRHNALLKVRPDNPGLNNSLAHLQANAANHAAKSSRGESRS
jgi:hypothetical protein